MKYGDFRMFEIPQETRADKWMFVGTEKVNAVLRYVYNLEEFKKSEIELLSISWSRSDPQISYSMATVV